MKAAKILEGAAWAFALFVGLTLILGLTLWASGLEVIPSLNAIAQGAMGDKFGAARTFARATPLLLCGLGMALAWKARMYNIGGEGQYVAGGLMAAAAYRYAPSLPPFVFQLFALIAGCIGGGIIAFLAGWLQVKRGVQVVISTILMNFILINVLGWMVSGPLQESKKQIPQTERLPREMALWRPDPQTDLHLGMGLALVAAAGVGTWLSSTKGGFRLRLVGENPRAARASRAPVEAIQMQAMSLSGALCGVAGAVTYLGVSRQVGLGFAEGWGFLAIPTALLGALNPWGLIASSLYFGGLIAGSEGLARTAATGNTAIFIIQGVAVLAFISLRKVMAPKPKQEEDD
jgi:general nucleoside transport system permease protein